MRSWPYGSSQTLVKQGHRPRLITAWPGIVTGTPKSNVNNCLLIDLEFYNNIYNIIFLCCFLMMITDYDLWSIVLNLASWLMDINLTKSTVGLVGKIDRPRRRLSHFEVYQTAYNLLSFYNSCYIYYNVLYIIGFPACTHFPLFASCEMINVVKNEFDTFFFKYLLVRFSSLTLWLTEKCICIDLIHGWRVEFVGEKNKLVFSSSWKSNWSLLFVDVTILFCM